MRTIVKTQIDPISYRAALYNEDTTYASPIIGQPDHLLNLIIGFDYATFSMRFAMRYSAGTFKTANWFEALRGFSTDFIRYDLQLRQNYLLRD